MYDEYLPACIITAKAFEIKRADLQANSLKQLEQAWTAHYRHTFCDYGDFC
jgi:hypothetical protein